VVDQTKVERLLAKVSKEFTKRGAPMKPEDVFMPWDDTSGKSKGYVLTRVMAVSDIVQISVHGVP
jgi:translation initiation factor 3 subunit B